jgi:hypothetical protein
MILTTAFQVSTPQIALAAAAPVSCADYGTYTSSGFSTYVYGSAISLSAGDTINVTLTSNGGNYFERYYIDIVDDDGTVVSNSNNSSSTVSISYTAQQDISLRFRALDGYDIYATENASISYSLTTTCVPAGTVSGSTDSEVLSSVQTTAAVSIASTSAMIMTDAVSSGVTAGFGGGEFISGGPSNITLNFAEGIAARSEAAEGREAFKALGFDDTESGKSGLPAAVRAERVWNAWANLRGSWLAGNSNNTGNQLNGTAGIGYRITPDIIVGAMAGAETFDFNFKAVDATVQGSGGTIGAYTGWRVLPGIRLDAMAGWSGMSYDTSAGTASAKFDASRWLIGAGVTGSQQVGAFNLMPEARISAAFEDQDSYTDTLGTAHDGTDFYVGRTSIGGKAGWTYQMSESLKLTPFAGLYADWRFSDVNGAATSDTNTIIGDGWSGRTTAGFSLASTGGASFHLGGEVAGIGADTQVWTATGRFALDF